MDAVCTAVIHFLLHPEIRVVDEHHHHHHPKVLQHPLERAVARQRAVAGTVDSRGHGFQWPVRVLCREVARSEQEAHLVT